MHVPRRQPWRPARPARREERVARRPGSTSSSGTWPGRSDRATRCPTSRRPVASNSHGTGYGEDLLGPDGVPVRHGDTVPAEAAASAGPSGPLSGGVRPWCPGGNARAGSADGVVPPVRLGYGRALTGAGTSPEPRPPSWAATARRPRSPVSLSRRHLQPWPRTAWDLCGGPG